MESRVIVFRWLKNNRLVALLTCVKWKTLTFYLGFKLWLQLECAFCCVLVVRGQCTEEGPEAWWHLRGTTCPWCRYCSESCLKKAQGTFSWCEFLWCSYTKQYALSTRRHTSFYGSQVWREPCCKILVLCKSGRLTRHGKKGWSNILLSWDSQKTRFHSRKYAMLSDVAKHKANSGSVSVLYLLVYIVCEILYLFKDLNV